MVSRTRWTWVWVNSGSWWWTGRPGVLWFMGSQRVGHDWVTELNWTELKMHKLKWQRIQIYFETFLSLGLRHHSLLDLFLLGQLLLVSFVDFFSSSKTLNVRVPRPLQFSILTCRWSQVYKFHLHTMTHNLNFSQNSCLLYTAFPLRWFSSVQFSHSVVSDSLQPHESQHSRPPCPSPTPGVHSDSRYYIYAITIYMYIS